MGSNDGPVTSAIDRTRKVRDSGSGRYSLRGDRAPRGFRAGRARWRRHEAPNDTSGCGVRWDDDRHPRGGRSAAGAADGSARWASAYLSRLDRRKAGANRAIRGGRSARASNSGRPEQRESGQQSSGARSVQAVSVPDRLLRPRGRPADYRARCCTSHSGIGSPRPRTNETTGTCTAVKAGPRIAGRSSSAGKGRGCLRRAGFRRAQAAPGAAARRPAVPG